jgi:hypothetical protein
MKQYIYESPDQGQTVYRREFGLSQRELHSISEEKRKWDLRLEREMLWSKIIEASKTDTVLKDLVDQVEVYFRLKHEKN